jgi:hypothetical protein
MNICARTQVKDYYRYKPIYASNTVNYVHIDVKISNLIWTFDISNKLCETPPQTRLESLSWKEKMSWWINLHSINTKQVNTLDKEQAKKILHTYNSSWYSTND